MGTIFVVYFLVVFNGLDAIVVFCDKYPADTYSGLVGWMPVKVSLFINLSFPCRKKPTSPI